MKRAQLLDQSFYRLCPEVIAARHEAIIHKYLESLENDQTVRENIDVLVLEEHIFVAPFKLTLSLSMQNEDIGINMKLCKRAEKFGFSYIIFDAEMNITNIDRALFTQIFSISLGESVHHVKKFNLNKMCLNVKKILRFFIHISFSRGDISITKGNHNIID